MKKESKKKLFNSVLGLSIAGAIVTPVAIALGKTLSNDDTITNKINSGAIEATTGLTARDTFYLPFTPDNHTPNTSKGVPGGFVTVGKFKDGSVKLVCIDNKDPKKINWTLTVDGTIIGVEYNPYYDAVVVLYFKGTVVKTATSNKVTGVKTGGEIGLAKDMVITRFGVNGWEWKMTPIIRTSAEDGYDGATTDYLYYSSIYATKQSGQHSKFYAISVMQDWVREFNDHSFNDNSNDSEHYFSYWNIASFWYNKEIHWVSLVKIWNYAWGYNGVTAFYTVHGYVDHSKWDPFYYKSPNGWNPIWGITSSTSKIAQTSSTSISWNRNTGVMDILIPDNVNGYNENNNHRVPNLFYVRALPKSKTYYDAYSGFKPLWTNWKNGGERTGYETELWANYFDNSVQQKYGAEYAGQHGGHAPFVGIGWSSSFTSNYTNGKFAFLINSIENNVNPILLNNSTNLSNAKFYKWSNNAAVDLTEAWEYSGWPVNYKDSFNYDQQVFGIPILEYEENNTGTRKNTSNLLLLKNASNEALMIDNSLTSTNVQTPAAYAYNTTIEGAKADTNGVYSFNIGDSTKGIYSVDEAYLIKTFNIESQPWYNSDFLVSTLKINHARDDSIFTIHNSKYEINDSAKTAAVTFDLYATALYKNGRQQSAYLTNLKKSWWPNHKLATIRITGYQYESRTVGRNRWLSFESDQYGSKWKTKWIIPTKVKDDQYWANVFKNHLWQEICAGRVFINLKKVPTYNVSTWENDFNSFFNGDGSGFKIVSVSNAEGRVTYSAYLSVEYSKTTLNGGHSFFSALNATGLRIIKPTALKGNTLATKIVIGNDLAQYNVGHVTNNDLVKPSYVDPKAKVITKDQLREWIFNNMFAPAYETTTQLGSWDASNEYIDYLPWKAEYSDQIPKYWPFSKLTKDDITLSNFETFSALGIIKVDVSIHVYYANEANNIQWTKNSQIGSKWGTQELASAPKATFYIGGFRTDNIYTNFDQTKTWNFPTQLNSMIVTKLNVIENIKPFRETLLTEGVKQGLLTLPYDVSMNQLLVTPNGGELLYELIESDNSTGTGKFKVSLKNYNFVENGPTYQNDPTYKFTITVSGFQKVNPIKIDTAKFFARSKNSNSDFHYDLSVGITASPTNKFKIWLDSIKNDVVNEIAKLDSTQNGVGARTLDQWKKTLQFSYYLNDVADANLCNNDSELNTKVKAWFEAQNASLGKFNDDHNKNEGLKIWIKINDTGVDYNSTLEDASTDQKLGKQLSFLLDTSGVIADIDMRNWLNNLSKYKGTAVTEVENKKNTVTSIIPPVLQEAAPGKGKSFAELEAYLKTCGYAFDYSWVDSNGQKHNLGTLPNEVEYDSANPVLDVTIRYNNATVLPRIYIFGDNLNHAITEHKATLSFAVKKTLNVTLTPFKSMLTSNEFSSRINSNINITKNGDYDITKVQSVIQAWDAFEEAYWKTNVPAHQLEEYKKVLELKYSVNNSDYIYDDKTIWAIIGQGWKTAINDSSKSGLLRFYSPSINQGTIVKVTVKLKEGFNYENDYILNYVSNEQEIVNHGLGTTIDFSNYRDFYQSNNAQVLEGSTADNLKGFTLPIFNGNSFEALETTAEEQLGLMFQWSSDKKTWFSTKEEVKSVDKTDPAIYLRITSSTTDHVSWSNELEVANFASKTSNSISIQDEEKWTDGIKIPLNLPKYLVIAQEAVDNFIKTTSLAWSGNTKYISIDDKIMKAGINTFISKIIADNNLTNLLNVDDFDVEFKVDAKDASSGAKFTKYSTSFTSTISNGNYWQSYANGVLFRVVLKAKNDNNPDYDKVETTYDANEKYVLKVKPYWYFDNNADNKDYDEKINRIKVFTESFEDKVNKIKVNGTTIDEVQFTYPETFIFDPIDNVVYTDNTRKWIVQFSLAKLVEDYNSYNSTTAGWTNTPPKAINLDKNLFVRVVMNPEWSNYIYGPAYEKTAKAWRLDTAAIKPVINADVSQLANLLLEGTINVGEKNNVFDLPALKNKEQAIIKSAVKNELGQSKISIVYNLKKSNFDTNEEWITLEELVAKLETLSKDYASENFGIASFIANQLSLKATFKSTDPEYNVIDSQSNAYEAVNQGVKLSAEQIVTQFDLVAWIDFLQKTKTLVVPRTSSLATRSLVNLNDKMLQPPAMTGDTNSAFLAGRTFDEIFKLLNKTFGIKFEFSTNKTDWYQSIDLVPSFDETKLKVYVKIHQSLNPQIVVLNTTKISPSIEFEMNIKYPKTLAVDDQLIQNYMNSNPLSGNTKFLTIDQAKEKTLIDKIVQANPPVAGDPAPNVWVEYRIGDKGTWMKRDEFIAWLAKQTSDQTTNRIDFKLNVDPVSVDEPLYSITDRSWTLSSHDISALTKIKIYVNKNYEADADKVKIVGTNEIFNYIYGTLPVDSKIGTWSGSSGLTIQWTTDSSATYEDPAGDQKWSSSQISKIDANARYLAIRIIAQDGYIYSADYESKTNIHKVNTDEIKSMLEVNLADLKQIQYARKVAAINVNEIKTKEQQILAAMKETGQKLDIKYKVVLSNGNEMDSEWLSIDEIATKLKEYSENFNSSTQGVIKFGNENFEGAKVLATFVVKPEFATNYTPVDRNADVTKGIEVDASKVVTEINLAKWFEVLKVTPISFADGSTAAKISDIKVPGMENQGNKGSGFLNGYTYDEIIAILASAGISPKYQAPGSTTNDQWVDLVSITNLNDKNELFVRFEVNEHCKDSVALTGIKGVQDNSSPEAVQLKVNLPLVIKVNLEYLKQLSFAGTTINLTNYDDLKTKEEEIKKAVIQANLTNNTETDKEIQTLQIGILYSLNNEAISSNKVWYSLDEIKEALATSTTNFKSNKVLAKFVILNNSIIDEAHGIYKYELSNTKEQIINEEQFSDDAQFKVYIHSVNATNKTWIWENLKLSGAEDNYAISNYGSWTLSIPKGLSVEYNSTPVREGDGFKPDDQKWTSEYNANPITGDKKYWIRFVVQAGFVFENASTSDNKHSDPIELDATQVVVNVKLSSEWLKSITLSGNLKDLEINEEAAIQKVVEAGQMFVKDLIQVEYTIDGIEWLTKDNFKAKLVEYAGGNNDRWIFLREDLKARWNLNPIVNAAQEKPFGLEVDKIVVQNQSDNVKVQLIDDANSLNTGVKGYINANKLTPFIGTNFLVRGTSSKANLTIQNVAEFNRLLEQYASKGIIQIVYTPDKQQIFDNKNQIFGNDQPTVQRNMSLNGDYAQKYIAIALQSISDKYDVYRDDQIKDSKGYVITSEDAKDPIDVKISTEIKNPLIGKTISIKFLDENNKPVWYNKKGALFFSIDDSSNKYTSLKAFLDNLVTQNGITQEIANVLELCYYVSDHKLSDEEYKEATSPIKILSFDNNEFLNNWKSLPDNIDIATDLKLAVNNYVMLALRVKKEFITSEANPNGYVLADEQYTPTKSERVFGYKVVANNVNVNWDSLETINVGINVANSTDGVDGYAMLNVIKLVPDANGDYLNVGLKLNYYNEFHTKDNKILTSGSSNVETRLVKRETGESLGFYKDKNNQEIIDDQGQKIPIYVMNTDSGSKIPTAPVKSQNVTRSKDLLEIGENLFTLKIEDDVQQQMLHSFFKNQTVSIQFENKKGDAPDGLFDYYVDETIQREHTITGKIKFPITNSASINYEFNSADFNKELALEDGFINPNGGEPTSGSAQINKQYHVIKTWNEAGTPSEKEITTFEDILKELESDFNGLLKLKVTYISADGSSKVVETGSQADITKNPIFNSLKNGDKFIVEIVASDEENWIFTEQPAALIIPINGLKTPNDVSSAYQYLRVEQKGEWDGEGSFVIHLNEPNTDPVGDPLNGWKFVIRVWNKDKTIKHDWTDKWNQINDLSNGDWVEWKVQDPDGNPGKYDYYNTIAKRDEHDANNRKYVFEEIRSQGNGNVVESWKYSSTIVGNQDQWDNPENYGKQLNGNQYPGDFTQRQSGFIIANLKEKEVQPFPSISNAEFIRIIDALQFSYTGLNGAGNMVSSQDIQNVIINVDNHSLVTYQNSNNAREAKQYTLKDLVESGYITFYYNNKTSTDLNQFAWNQVRDENGNWKLEPGCLTNGDIISVKYNDGKNSYVQAIGEVYGLKEHSDSMSMLVWVAVGIASVASLGIFFWIYLWARNRKLKD